MREFKAILPKPGSDSAEFWEGCNRNELLLRHCDDCREPHYYPRLHCPRCGGQQLSWRRSSGHGVIYSYSRVEVSFYGKTWESELPYTVVLVDLQEGPRMLSRLSNERAHEVAVGMPVMVDFVKVAGEEQALPFFKLAK